jgi:catechol 2,3-dioxygenase-like lactoylglutathione lyase family enzyme
VFSHVTFGASDLQRAKDFYGPLMEILGFSTKFSDAQWAGWKHPAADRPLFFITQPFDGGPVSPGNGPMVAFLAATRALVDRCYEHAMIFGVVDEGRPGPRPNYHPNFYGAYFRDPDGNKLCVCCHEPEDASDR